MTAYHQNRAGHRVNGTSRNEVENRQLVLNVHQDASPTVYIAFCLLLIYPTLYDGRQMIKSGLEYFEGWNIVDMGHIITGYTMVAMQIIHGHRVFVTKLSLVLSIFLLSLIHI